MIYGQGAQLKAEPNSYLSFQLNGLCACRGSDAWCIRYNCYKTGHCKKSRVYGERITCCTVHNRRNLHLCKNRLPKYALLRCPFTLEPLGGRRVRSGSTTLPTHRRTSWNIPDAPRNLRNSTFISQFHSDHHERNNIKKENKSRCSPLQCNY